MKPFKQRSRCASKFGSSKPVKGRESRVDRAARPMLEALESRVLLTSVPGWSGTVTSVSYPTIIVNQPVVLTATVAATSGGTPTGTVAFISGNEILGFGTLSGGVATAVTTGFPQGNVPLVAVYEGDANFGGSASVAANETVDQTNNLAGGLQEGTTQAGSGNTPAADGNTLSVHYTGYLTNGTVFDSTAIEGGSDFVFTLGRGQVIAGWDEGLVGMDVGETRTLIIPPSLGYGSSGQGSIPPNATLIFTVTLDQFVPPRLAVADANGGNAIVDGGTPSGTNGTDFGTITVGQSSGTITYDLSAANQAPLNFTGAVTVTGNNPGDFILTQPTTSNGQTTMTLTFHPSATGQRTAIITIPTTDQLYPNFTFEVVGVGA